jgi:hypothetical protein
LLQQGLIGAEAAHAVGLVLAAEQADAQLRHLRRPGLAARLGHADSGVLRAARGRSLWGSMGHRQRGAMAAPSVSAPR